jgi:CrcB protein
MFSQVIFSNFHPQMKLALIIGIGSFIGGFSRYLLSLFIQAKTTSPFPLHTLIVNIIGCFFIGIIFGFFDKGQIANEWKLFLATGILGGFTTFSAFSIETLTLFREGYTGYALLYIFASVLLGLLLTCLAYILIKLL